MANLSEYFEHNYKFYLLDVSYRKIADKDAVLRYRKLTCTDTVSAKVVEDRQVELVVSRSLKFDPEGLFTLSVSFGAELNIIPEKFPEMDWNEMDLAEEFRQNGDFVLKNMVSRISMLIASITSSYGQQPVISPPVIYKNGDQ